MLAVGEFLAGVCVGFGLATALCRGYVRRLEQIHQTETDRPAVAATPVALPPSENTPTARPRRRTASTARDPRRQLPGAAAPPAPTAPIATAPTDDVTLPRAIVEQVYAQLARLDALERRASLRLVPRTDRRRPVGP